MTWPLLLLCSLSLCTFTATALVPAEKNSVRIPASASNITSSSQKINATPSPPAPYPIPVWPDEPYTCLKKPRLYHITPSICSSVFGALLNAPVLLPSLEQLKSPKKTSHERMFARHALFLYFLSSRSNADPKFIRLPVFLSNTAKEPRTLDGIHAIFS